MVNRIYNNIIFDLDGTLVNTAPDIALCVNKLLKARFIPPIDNKTISFFIG